MGTSLLHPHLFSAQSLFSFLNPHQIPRTSSFSSPTHPNNNRSTRRIRINFEDEFFTDGDDEFRFSGYRKKREWWSNDDSNNFFDDEEEEEDEFWIFKVFRALSWMVPAISISLLLGTGPNAFLMALAVPLGQTALSLVIDKVWGRTTRRSKPSHRTETRTSTRKKPFVRPRTREETSNRKEDKAAEEKGSYESWTEAAGRSRKNNGKRVHPFGGWDELDELHKVPTGTPKEKADDELPKQQSKGKLSRTRRVRDKPLLLRLMIAVFPFLGSWTRFFF